MNFRALTSIPRQPSPSLSRRQFGRALAGTAAVGGALGSTLLKQAPAMAAAGTFAPVPIPGGTPGLGGAYHVFAPGLDPEDAEPSTITNMNGFVGIAYIS